jgi:hypothetical protein
MNIIMIGESHSTHPPIHDVRISLHPKSRPVHLSAKPLISLDELPTPPLLKFDDKSFGIDDFNFGIDLMIFIEQYIKKIKLITMSY